MISVPQLLYDIQQELGSFFTTESFNTTTLLKTINSGVRKVCLAANWKFNDYTYTLTTDGVTEEYTIPEWFKIYAIKVGGDSSTYIPVSFEEYFSDDTSSDQNKIGFKQDRLYTKQALTMTLVYRGIPPRLYVLEGNIDLPETTYDILLAACVYYGFLSCKQFPRADKRVLDFKDEVNRVRAMETDPFPRKPLKMNKSYSLRSR